MSLADKYRKRREVDYQKGTQEVIDRATVHMIDGNGDLHGMWKDMTINNGKFIIPIVEGRYDMDKFCKEVRDFWEERGFKVTIREGITVSL